METNGRVRKYIVIIEAPSNLGLKPLRPGREPGVCRGPEALKMLGLLGAVPHKELLRVDAPFFRDDANNPTGVRQAAAIASYSRQLSRVIEQVIRDGKFPLVIGGDCSILLGSMLGAKRVQETSLLFVDGHTDFFLPSQSETGGAAGMDLALVAGWGPSCLTDIEAQRPYVKLEHVAAIGSRDLSVRSKAEIPELADSASYYKSLDEVRATGIENTVGDAIEHIGGVNGPFWLHLDVDAIDDAIMPAVDSPQEGGFTEGEIIKLLVSALEMSPVGMEVTIYDPDIDHDNAAGRTLVHILGKVFSNHYS